MVGTVGRKVVWICSECNLVSSRRWNLYKHLVDVHGYRSNEALKESYESCWIRKVGKNAGQRSSGKPKNRSWFSW